MTEEVIKECEFYLPFSENCNEILDDNGNETYKCSSRQDCYYKQLIRLKQQHNDDTEEIAKLGLDVAILEQENKELKETIKQYCEWLDEERESNDKLQKVYQDDHCDLLNYRSALEEIRSYCTGCEDGINARKIKEYINEVIG